MKKMLVFSLSASAVVANAGTLFFDGYLDGNSATYNNGTGGGNNPYMAVMVMVYVTGQYTIETASPNSSPTVPSNALDTYLRLFPSSWVPASGASGAIASNDDYTGALSVLPGPYAGTVGPNGTGYTGLQPASRILNVNLTANTQYWLVNTSFQSVGYVQQPTLNEGGSVGAFYTGISGPGNIVPEPGTFIAIGIGLASLALAHGRKHNRQPKAASPRGILARPNSF